MAGLTLKGTVVEVRETQEPKPGFTKRELWLEIDQDTDYSQIVSIEFIKDKCSIIDKYSAGDVVEVDINIRGNKATMKDGTEKVFNSMNGWRIAGSASGGTSQAPKGEALKATPQDAGSSDEPDDLPF